MNKLSYGLLSLLSTEPMTGYDLTVKINKFWRSTHSAIYPLLSELDKKGYVELTLVKQSGKPDKKIYNLTTQGKELLHDWFTSETAEEVVRDEMTLKLYCISYMDTESSEKLLNEFEVRCRRKVETYKSIIEKTKLKSYENSEDVPASLFGSYILTQRALNNAILELKWCEWVRKLYKNKDLSFLEEDFN
ncbi:PadR family transcriptional regulator [Clostridium botulinum]|uniref:PadR family transcriptional regulator n=1 Tax=Clostridium botulinum TaxID=1491 RepID=UPI000774872F|nr:PadR family transcriptional regulator [Clostridium botulinum]